MSEYSDNKNEDSNNIDQESESKESESKESKKLTLIIRSPSEIAYLNAIKHASDLGQLVEIETYLTPSMLSQDEHSDLEATSPKLKFGDTQIYEFISKSPVSSLSSDSPKNVNIDSNNSLNPN